MLNFILITLKYLRSLIVKSLLNVIELIGVVSAHLLELELHRGNQKVYVVVLLLQSVHVLIILGLELLHKKLNQRLFLRDDLSTGIFLPLDVLYNGQ